MWNRLIAKATVNAFLRPREFIVVKDRRHQSLFGQSRRYPRRIAGDPTPPPLLRYQRRCATAASEIHHQVARISGHKHAPLDEFFPSLHHIQPGLSSSLLCPAILKGHEGKIVVEQLVIRVS